jgi:hypothetical protein
MGRMMVSVLLVALAFPCSAQTSDGPRRELRNVLGMSVNNIGLQDSLELSWIRSERVRLVLNPVVSPSYGRAGAWARFTPHPAFELGAGLEPAAYFGTFNSLKSFESYSDPFDGEARSERESHFGVGGRACLAPRLRMKAGPIVAQAGADLEWVVVKRAGPLLLRADPRHAAPGRRRSLARDVGRAAIAAQSGRRRNPRGRRELRDGLRVRRPFEPRASARRARHTRVRWEALRPTEAHAAGQRLLLPPRSLEAGTGRRCGGGGGHAGSLMAASPDEAEAPLRRTRVPAPTDDLGSTEAACPAGPGWPYSIG